MPATSVIPAWGREGVCCTNESAITRYCGRDAWRGAAERLPIKFCYGRFSDEAGCRQALDYGFTVEFAVSAAPKAAAPLKRQVP